ncbi:MAG: hypothetical protein ACRCS0_06210, partial [Albidovulum sp.]
MTAPFLPPSFLDLIPYRQTTPPKPRTQKEKTVFATITLAGTVTAQGPIVEKHVDGRVTIADGSHRLTGWPIRRALRGTLSAVVLALLALG